MKPPELLTRLPRLSAARAPLTREAVVVAHDGHQRAIQLAAERPLTLYVDRREVVTLMTLGQEPELLALGYLLNQGLVESAREVESITVDWAVAGAAVRTVQAAEHDRGGEAGGVGHEGDGALAERLARRTVTTGCGQGTVFGDWLQRVAPLPPAGREPGSVPHAAIVSLLDAMRRQPSVHRDAGSVHGTALWRGARLLVHVEDVGRHNAVDTVAGWMAMKEIDGAECWLYTTGRLTSEMVLKAVHLRVPVVISRNGATAMGQELAERLELTLIGRASGQRYLCYSGAARLAPGPD